MVMAGVVRIGQYHAQQLGYKACHPTPRRFGAIAGALKATARRNRPSHRSSRQKGMTDDGIVASDGELAMLQIAKILGDEEVEWYGVGPGMHSHRSIHLADAAVAGNPYSPGTLTRVVG